MKETLLGARYRLLDLIGSGGEARVFRARDEATGKEVALRLGLKPATIPPLGHLPPFHENWVRLLDLGDDPQHGAYQVFELLEGETLQQLVLRAPLTPDDWLLFVHQSLDAIEALHAAGWIHGDLNADNFFHTSSGWKLLEMPFLRFIPQAARSNLFGSIHTLSPEQLKGNPPDVRSDLYALGCLYYYAASGRWPHPGASTQEITISRLRFPATPLSQSIPNFPAPGCDWAMSLLALEPQNRPASVAAARQMLKVA